MQFQYRISALIAVIFSLLLIGSCTSDSTTGGSNFDRPAMLSNYGNNTILPAYQNLQQAVNQLKSAVNTFADDPTVANLEAAQTQLKSTRLAWQDANIFQFGPAESVALRGALNTYPADSAKVESNIESGDYTLGTIDNQSAAGFPTVGYLLHGVAPDNQEIVARYTSGDHASARTTYLQDNVSFIKTNVDDTANEWAESGGNYIREFLSEENAGTDVGSSLGMMINALVLHYERFLRDGKVGIPAGVRSAEVGRPKATEAYYGGYSVELAIANLEAMKRFFKGKGLNTSDGLGLEENLQALNAPDLATKINTELEQARASLQELNDPLSEQIESNNEPVLTAFQELQDVVTPFKSEMTSIMGIRITYQDNDGD